MYTILYIFSFIGGTSPDGCFYAFVSIFDAEDLLLLTGLLRLLLD